MDPLTLAAIGAGLGLLQSGQQKEAARRQAILQANVARFQPYTGMAPDLGAIKDVDTMGNVAAGAMSGYGLGSNIAKSKSDDAFRKAVLEKMGGGTQASPDELALDMAYTSPMENYEYQPFQTRGQQNYLLNPQPRRQTLFGL